jgi:tRNA 2-thiouridine synthesizing protein A
MCDQSSLDLRGLRCPLPALFARRALLRAEPGVRIVVISDDPLASVDVPHMCHAEGFEIVSVTREGDLVRVVARR